MHQKNKHSYAYYTALSIMLAVVYFIQVSTPLLPEIVSVRPMPAFVFMLCFAAYGGEAAGILSGLSLGIATDVVSSAPDGFNAVVMMLCGLACSLLAAYLFNSRLSAAAVLSGIITATYYLLHWLVCVVLRGQDGVWIYLWRFSLPGALYTWLFIFAFWPLVKTISNRNRPPRIKNWE